MRTLFYAVSLVLMGGAYAQPGGVIEAIAPGWSPVLSADGRLIAFGSLATLVPADTANADAYLYDRNANTFELLSVNDLAVAGNGASLLEAINLQPAMSADGRYVAYHSTASDLVPNDNNGRGDIFVRDRMLGTTERASLGIGELGSGAQGTIALRPDGRRVFFTTADTQFGAFAVNKIVERDLELATSNLLVTDGSGPLVSDDGQILAFHSENSSFGAADSNDGMDVFVLDRNVNTFELASRSAPGVAANQDCLDGPITICSFINDLSSNGRFVLFESTTTDIDAGDQMAAPGIFVLDRQADRIERLRNELGAAVPVALRGNGRLSSDGRFVLISSPALELVAGDTNGFEDLFLFDRLSGAVERVSVDAFGNQANGNTTTTTSTFSHFDMTGDARTVAFASEATNLVAGGVRGTVYVKSPLLTQPRPDITPPVALVADARFGAAAAMSESFAAVGAPGVGDGAVGIYRFDGNEPLLVASLPMEEGASVGAFGASLGMSDEWVVVGGLTAHSAKGPFAGLQAAIYERLNRDWRIKFMARPNDPQPGDRFGAAVAIDGDTAAVGAPGADGRGAVYLFDITGDTAVQIARLTPDDSAASQEFGAALDFKDGVLAIGVPQGQIAGATTGLVTLYEMIADNLTRLGTINGQGSDEGDEFGCAVSLSGGLLAVGASGTDMAARADVGAVYTFDVDAQSVAQVARITPRDGTAGSRFGASIALSTRSLSIGAPERPFDDGGSGAVYQFHRRDNAVVQQVMLAADAGVEGFGAAIATNGHRVIAGAPSSNEAAGRAILLDNADVLFRGGSFE